MDSAPLADLPASLHERVVCSISAAMKYELPANILLAVAEKEGGKPGQWVKNTNGTHDVGAMQFNTQYLAELSRYGITANDVAAGGCYSFELAAWRLRLHIRKDQGDLWTRVANYHSRTPRYNARYRSDLMRRAARWADWLEARFVTRDVGRLAPPAKTKSSDAAAQLQAAPSDGRPVSAHPHVPPAARSIFPG